MAEVVEVEWKRWLDSYQYLVEIDGISCQIDAPYDDTVGYRIHVYRNHPRYPNGFMSVSAAGDADSFESAKYLAEKWARDMARWCSGPTARY